MIKLIYKDVQYNQKAIYDLWDALNKLDDKCENLRCVFKIKDDPLAHMWPLIDLPDHPLFPRMFIEPTLLEKLDVYEITK